jgi:hypothetical protein
MLLFNKLDYLDISVDSFLRLIRKNARNGNGDCTCLGSLGSATTSRIVYVSLRNQANGVNISNRQSTLAAVAIAAFLRRNFVNLSTAFLRFIYTYEFTVRFQGIFAVISLPWS